MRSFLAYLTLIVATLAAYAWVATKIADHINRSL